MTFPLIDFHIHTTFSPDSMIPMAPYCEAALSRHIGEIGFSDHINFFVEDPPDAIELFDPVSYTAAIDRCRSSFGKQLKIRMGVEIGEPHRFKEEVKAFIAQGEFDYIIGSAHHSIHMKAAWLPRYYEQPLEKAYSDYFQQVVDLAAEGEFDVLGHLDLVKRDAYLFSKPYNGPLPYTDMIMSALRSIVSRGKGIEINTSPFRRGLQEPCPSLEILRWYHQLGGEIITIGSDAHDLNAIGSHCETAVALARAVGFKRIASFEKRSIVWIPI